MILNTSGDNVKPTFSQMHVNIHLNYKWDVKGSIDHPIRESQQVVWLLLALK